MYGLRLFGSMTVQTPSGSRTAAIARDEAIELVDVVEDVDAEDDAGANVESGVSPRSIRSNATFGAPCAAVACSIISASTSTPRTRGRDGPARPRRARRPGRTHLENEIAGLGTVRDVARDEGDPPALEMTLPLTLVLGRRELEVGAHRWSGEVDDDDVGSLDHDRAPETLRQVRRARRICDDVSDAERPREATALGAAVEDRCRSSCKRHTALESDLPGRERDERRPPKEIGHDEGVTAVSDDGRCILYVAPGERLTKAPDRQRSRPLRL